MGEAILGWAKANWSVIEQAPWVFAGWTVLIFGAAWFLVGLLKANQMESLDKRLALRDDEIADYRRKLQGATPDEARARIADLETKVAALQPRQRSLSGDQKVALVESAKAVEPPEKYQFVVIYPGPSHESAIYADDFAEAYKGIGWDTFADVWMSGHRLKKFGITILIHDLEAKNDIAVAVAHGLTAAGIAFNWEKPTQEPVDEDDANRVYLCVDMPD